MSNTLRHILLSSLVAALLATAGCATSNQGASASDPVSLAAHTPELSTFHKLVEQAGLGATLASGTYTVFAPTDAAFKAVPAATLDKLAKDPELLKSVLAFHVLPGAVPSTAIDVNKTAETLNGAKVTVAKAGDMITVEEGLVVQPDLQAGKSVVHVIDAVLMPPKK